MESLTSLKKRPVVNFNTEGISSIQSLGNESDNTKITNTHIYREGGDPSPIKPVKY
jgi:hypothetical protein